MKQDYSGTDYDLPDVGSSDSSYSKEFNDEIDKIIASAKAKASVTAAAEDPEEFFNQIHSKADGKFATTPGSAASKPMAPMKGIGSSPVKGVKGLKAPKIPKLKPLAAPAKPTSPMAPNRVGQRLLNKKAGGPGQTTLHLSEISKEGVNGMISRLHEVGAVPKNLKTAEEVTNFIAKNVTDVYNKVSVLDRAAWKQWYPGANKLGADMAGKPGEMSKGDLGLSHQGANAAIAVLSPGTNWNINVAQSRTAIKILREDKPLTAAQAKTANGLAVSTFGRQHAVWVNTTTAARAALTELHSQRTKATDLKQLKDIDAAIAAKQAQALKVEPVIGKLPHFNEGDKPSTMTDYATGYAMRAVTPHPVAMDVKIKADGTYDDRTPMMTKAGKVWSAQWQSYSNLAKLTSVYRDSSIENISKNLGNAHKVRSFFNNINDPHNAAGDVTIDTHAYGIGLGKPLSMAHPWIATAAGSKNITARPSSVPDGTSGVYALIQEGFAKAAKQAGVEPREMQSITWEAWRRMHTVAERKANVVRIGKEGKKAVL